MSMQEMDSMSGYNSMFRTPLVAMAMASFLPLTVNTTLQLYALAYVNQPYMNLVVEGHLKKVQQDYTLGVETGDVDLNVVPAFREHFDKEVGNQVEVAGKFDNETRELTPETLRSLSDVVRE